MAEKKGSGFTPPGVYGNPREANGKQWGGETGSQQGDAGERDGSGERTGRRSTTRRQGGERPGGEASRPGGTGHRGAPVREARVPEEAGGEWLVRDFQTGNGSREGRCDGSRKNTARTSSGPAVPD